MTKPTALLITNKIDLMLTIKNLFNDDELNLLSAVDYSESINLIDDWSLSLDLVIIEQEFFEKKGQKLILEIKDCFGRENIPILVLSKKFRKNEKYMCLKNGAYDFIKLPFDSKELKFKVKNILTKQKEISLIENKANDMASRVENATNKIIEREKEAIFRLSLASEYRDPETGMHIKRMSSYAELICLNLGLNSNVSSFVAEAAQMHDVGKVGIPDNILLKEGKLTIEEFKIMQSHTEIGYRILKDSPSELLRMAADIALHHHEKFDGTGYPRGIKGTDIPLEARISAVADVFDALTTERPYKKAWTVEDTINLLKEESGKHFDPSCVDALLNDIDKVLLIKNKFSES